ncbi:MAG: DNA polymerase I, partial [Microscillaceae bacterium]|nr:DNA polymerase I [Microscillaceae bacterium]MDW8461188.1 DNA polymerase I [Cytophagales bacterium]
ELEFRTLAKRLFKNTTIQEKEKNPTETDLFGNIITHKKPQTTATPKTDKKIQITENELVEQVSDINSPTYKNIQTQPHFYYLLNTFEQIQLLATQLAQLTEFCLDTETTSLEAYNAELVGIAFAWYPHEAYFVIPPPQSTWYEVLPILQPIFENETITKIGQNLKYDLAVLKNYGIHLKGKLWDTMLAHYLLEPDMRHNMDVLAKNYLHYEPIEIEALIGKKGKDQASMTTVEIELLKEYACEDADITFQLKQVFEPKIQKQGLEKLFFEVEAPLIEVLAAMEAEGVNLDVKVLSEISKDLDKEIQLLEHEIYRQAGTPFNIASPKQLGEILFEKLKLDPKAKKTKTGQYATGEEILVKLASEHPIIQQILEYRELQKLKSTYVDALPQLISPKDKRLHTSYNQAVATTGRLSSSNPNLQNIPIRTEKGREIRKAFVPRNKDFVILSADYSQIELRIMALFSRDETMLQAFQQGKDIHAITASKIYKVPLEQVNSDMRRKAKTANFGIIYGISAFGLAQRLNIPRKEASELINAYWQEFPAIKQYMENIVNKARQQEYVETILGRRRYLRNINSQNAVERAMAERNAINAPIQGSAADMIKLAMIRIYQFLTKEKLQTKMILQVHDELVFDAHKAELEYVKQNVAQLMKNALVLDVPIEVDLRVGEDWLKAH